MEEKDLISKLSFLKGVKPRQEWAFLLKQDLLSSQDNGGIVDQIIIPQAAPLHKSFGFRIIKDWSSERLMTEAVSVFRYLTVEKPAFMLAGVSLFMIGGLGLHTNQSLPGDMLYSVRSVAEEAQGYFTTKSDVPQLKAAQRRLEDLKKIVQENKSRNLSFAIKEFENSVSGASKQLAKLAEHESGKALVAGKEILELQREKVRIEETLGAKLSTENGKGLNEAAKVVVEIEFADLETRMLTASQQEVLAEAKTAYEAGEYDIALEKILFLSQESVDY